MTLPLLPFDPLSPLPGVLAQARLLAAGMALPLGVSLELTSLPWPPSLPPLHRAVDPARRAGDAGAAGRRSGAGG
jgi:hypothetical protein